MFLGKYISSAMIGACVIVLTAGNAFAGVTTERCYGVALAGKNEGLDQKETPGTSKVDYQGNAWIAVPMGECARMTLPDQADGTPRRGALEPLSRDAGK